MGNMPFKFDFLRGYSIYVLSVLMRLCLFVVSVKSMALVNRDFCMSDPFPCQPSDISKAIGTFPGVHSQSGCAERCQQYEKCYK